MHDSIRPIRVLAVAALASGILTTGCGAGRTQAHTAANVSATATTGSATTTTGGAGSPGLPPAPAKASGLAFARCMRANGVPNFPDPIPGRGLLFSTAGINPAAPAVKSAQATCRKLLPAGPPWPGTQTHPSAQTLAKLVRIARCMRDHGVSQFPDPTTSVPSNPAGIDQITDFDGAILLFGATLNLQAPAYRRALAECHAPPLGLPH